jgi:hypothetical protein
VTLVFSLSWAYVCLGYWRACHRIFLSSRGEKDLVTPGRGWERASLRKSSWSIDSIVVRLALAETF